MIVTFLFCGVSVCFVVFQFVLWCFSLFCGVSVCFVVFSLFCGVSVCLLVNQFLLFGEMGE